MEKPPLALRQSAASCWAGQLSDGLQQTHEQKKGMPVSDEVWGNSVARQPTFAPARATDVYLFKGGRGAGGEDMVESGQRGKIM